MRGAFLLWVLGYTPQKPSETLSSRIVASVEICYSCGLKTGLADVGGNPMKKFLIAGVAAAALYGTPTLAADMAVKAPPPLPVPVYSWTGWYAGGNIGYSWGNGDSNYYWSPGIIVPVGLPDPISTSQKLDGAIGGVQIGYNLQVNNLSVVGLETDFQASGEKGSTSFSDPYEVCTQELNTNLVTCPDPTYTGTISSAIQWFGTLRARGGLLVTPTTLVYGTGGLAYGRISTSGTINNGIESGSTWSFSNSTTNVGWTAGGGIEGAVSNSNNWTWKIEYLYIDFGTVSGNGINPEGNPYNYSTKVTDNVLRVGLNYLFH